MLPLKPVLEFDRGTTTNELFVFPLVAAPLFFLLSLSAPAVADKNRTVLPGPTETPQFSAEIEELELDRNEVIIPCPPTFKLNGSVCEDAGLIKIGATAKNPQNSRFDYYYTVSGGKIIGRGANVIWDLTNVREGDYTISAQVGNEYRFSDKTITETIRVRDCDCCLPICTCPALDVSGGGGVSAGETVNLEATVSGGKTDDITYNWTVSQGEIVEGQGTPKIRVKTTSAMSGNINATVEIGGSELCSRCLRTASETATVIK